MIVLIDLSLLFIRTTSGLIIRILDSITNFFITIKFIPEIIYHLREISFLLNIVVGVLTSLNRNLFHCEILTLMTTCLSDHETAS
ncbi:hypothetical protein BpHYR1_024142 [Brachionus plicatilis]|uniref:Uncharacterized protein n=1 Tax=Brachionus plicatilis TaxID=10195 RepID=A0A3M7TAC6_BRAPC|nr:hypothetical protein BpHYR1_024142 [Brachionus plicatilis]